MAINIFDVEENKISTNLSGYSLVLLGMTGHGKTYSLNKILTEINDGKKPLFIMLEDRYQHIPGIKALRVRSIPELEAVKNQLKSPKAKELYSCIVIDTADKLDAMIEKYVAAAKEVEISGDLNFGKGNKYIKNKLYFIDEIRNAGWTIHFTAQLFKNTNILTQQVTYDVKLNKETWAKISHDAYQIGAIEIDPKNPSNRDITFEVSSEMYLLKNSLNMPGKVNVNEFKSVMIESLAGIEGAAFTDEDTLNISITQDETFEDLISRGNELGVKLAELGKLDQALNILKTNIGEQDNGQPKTFDDLTESQYELAQFVVMKLEELVLKYSK